MAKRRDMEQLTRRYGTFDAPIGTVQVPETGVLYDKRGNPKPLQSGQDFHPELERDPDAPRPKRKKRQPEPELQFSTDLFQADPRERAALTTCHKVLASRVVTEQQLRDKLVAAEHDDDMIEFALERCRVGGLVDDAAYARSWVESRIRRGHGARRIERDLAQKGVAKDHVAAALAELAGNDELDTGAIDAARKKAARLDLEDAATRAKLQRWLVGRGYSFAQVNDAVRAIRTEHADTRE